MLTAPLLLAGTAGARNPRLEQLALRPADQALVGGAILSIADLDSTWRQAVDQPNTTRPPGCARAPLDLSPLTLTGQAESAFTHTRREWILSRVQTYPTRRQAHTDYHLTTAAARTCNLDSIEHHFFPAGTRVRVLARRRAPLTGLGDRALTDRILVSVTRGHATSLLYLDAIDFVEGRQTATLVITGLRQRSTAALRLARLIAARLSTHSMPL